MCTSQSLYTICEDFLGFVQIEKMDAQTIADKIISLVTSWGLNMDNQKCLL